MNAVLLEVISTDKISTLRKRLLTVCIISIFLYTKVSLDKYNKLLSSSQLFHLYYLLTNMCCSWLYSETTTATPSLMEHSINFIAILHFKLMMASQKVGIKYRKEEYDASLVIDVAVYMRGSRMPG